MIIPEIEFQKCFSRLFFINLDNRKRKRKIMEKQLFNSSIPFTRISGVNCLDFIKYKIKNITNYNLSYHKGLIGCFLAHKKCLQYIQSLFQNKNNNKKFIITEDDIFFKKTLFKEIQELSVPLDCDILFLNSACLKGRPAPNKKMLVSENLYKINESYPTFMGAFFYIITYDVITRVLDKMQKIDLYEDLDMFLFNNFNCYTYITKNLSLIDFKSDRDPEAQHNKNKLEG